MSSTSPSIPGQWPDHGSFRVEKKKRNRIPVSCGPCRNRKLRCNRHTPCENCIKRNDVESCSYASSCGRRRKLQASGSFGSSDEMQSRIDRLESLVLSLMHSKQEHSFSGSESSVRYSSVGRGTKSSHVLNEGGDGDEYEYEDHAMVTDTVTKEDGIKSDSDSQVEEVRHALGVMQVGKGLSYFRGETHINTILQEISEIKAFYQQTKDNKALNAADHAETFPFAAGARLSKEELIELIPPKSVTDCVVDNYFVWHDPLFHVIHKPGFFREYDEFWRNPQSADPLWLALLFITMHQSWKLFAFSGNGPAEYQSQATEIANEYRHASEAALIVGEFTKKKSYHYNSLRTLYLMCASGSYGPDHTWLLMGWVVRIAMVMGLHRDGEQYGLPPFEIEIRRRLWTSLLCMDYVYSIQIGLPSMIRNMDFDTKVPNNFEDDELTEDLKEMPTPHGFERRTDITYLIFKVGLIRTYGEIVAHANAIGPRPSYDEVRKFDAELRNTFACLPDHFRLLKPLDGTTTPEATQPILLEFLYHKAIVTLHRPYASRARANPKYNYSRKELIASCIAMMNHQFSMREFDDARLKLIRLITCGIASYDFAHAAISLCVDVWECLKAGELEAQPQVGEVNPRTIIEVLERARSHYNPEKSRADPNSQKAHDIICTVLDKVQSLSRMRTKPQDQRAFPKTEYAALETSPGAATPETPLSMGSTQLETPQEGTPRKEKLDYNDSHMTPVKSEDGVGFFSNSALYNPASPPQSENAASPFSMTGFFNTQEIPGNLNWVSIPWKSAQLILFIANEITGRMGQLHAGYQS
ncbi:fungal-specific transcription factor domain-containing protein [Terfezia claveryi]|nr:fungal-specific transcription factor domain-containing protein [Terfezia claveryi]